MFRIRSITLHSSDSFEKPPETGHADARPNTLAPIGWDQARIAEFTEHANSGLSPGRVARVDGQSVMLITATGTVRAESSTELQQLAETSEDRPATGDWVGLRQRPSSDLDVIEVVLRRRSQLSRTRQVMKSAVEQQIVAVNIDVAFIVHAANNVNLRRLEREASQVATSGAAVVIVLNKADLTSDTEARSDEVRSILPQVDVHAVSGVTGERVEALAAYARPDRTVVFIGASGVGKSTLINRLLGREVMDTGAVREDDQRGRHTTTTRYLHPLDGGGALIDTPGIRSIGLSGADDGVAAVFDDIAELALTCRFNDCSHGDEPGCAVQDAIRRGELEAARLASFQKLGREVEFVQSKSDMRLRNARRDIWKARAKSNRERMNERQ